MSTIKRLKRKSKKGDLPVTLLVIGVFVLCGFALLTFFISDFRISNSFVGVSLTSKVTSFMDEYLFYKDSGMSSSKINSFFNVSTQYGKDSLSSEYFSSSWGIPFVSGKSVKEFSVVYQIPSGPFPVTPLS